MNNNKNYDFVIIGAGIIGLTVAKNLQQKYSNSKILVLEKESAVALHASGRNSGVLHAGLYYAQDSLKSKFCISGSKLLTQYCHKNNITLNKCGKVVVVCNNEDLQELQLLYKKALDNGANIQLIDEEELNFIEPFAKTYKQAIFSPDSSSFDGKKICLTLQKELEANKVDFSFNTKYINGNNNFINTSNGVISFGVLINCAGMYADKIAINYNAIDDHILIPIKGVFLNVSLNLGQLKKHIYRVPDKNLKLVGVHFSPDAYGNVKLGPTAIPCLSRENYQWLSNLKFNEIKEVLLSEFKLFLHNKDSFRTQLFEEIKKQTKKGLIKYGSNLVKNINQFQFTNWNTPGIQPKLYNTKTQKLINDFVIKKQGNTLHIINSVSPAFTASFAFSKYIVDTYL